MYEETKQYIFSEIGKRVKKKKKEKKLTYYQLAGYKNKEDYMGSLKGQGEDNEVDKQFRYNKFDYSLITNIAGGRAYPKKNPNLVPDLYIEHLSEKLGFYSGKELLWGDLEKDSSLQLNIFRNLFNDILLGTDEDMKETYNSQLLDYVPYSEYYTYWQMFETGEIDMPKFPNSNYTIPGYFYQIKPDTTVGQYTIQKENAINYTWYKFDTMLLKLINNFLENDFKVKFQNVNNNSSSNVLYTLKKLNKKLDDLAQRIQLFFRENALNENSLGLRVRNIIVSDYKKIGNLIVNDMNNIETGLSELGMKYLVESSLAYITALKRVQVIELKGYEFDK